MLPSLAFGLKLFADQRSVGLAVVARFGIIILSGTAARRNAI
jgi:hypothetical protein